MTQPLTITPQVYPLMSSIPMPQTSYASQTLPQSNAVKIDIHNPYASNQPSTTYSPYAIPQASAYAPYVPNAALTTPMYATQMAQPYIMPTPVAQQVINPIPVAPQVVGQIPVAPPAPPAPPAPVTAPVAPAHPAPAEHKQVQPIIVPPSVVVPQPVLTNQPQIINAPQSPIVVPVPPAAIPAPTPVVSEQAPTVAQTPVQAEATATAEAQAPKVETPASTPVNVDLNQVISKLNSTNPDTQLAAIESIAETAQSNPKAATQLLDTQIMDALANIIKRDTKDMQAPTPEQLKLRQKLISGEKLTPEETTSANQISEMEIAERNKQFALYTVAILQKLLSTEVEKAQGTKLELKDLPMINDIVKIAKADENPMLRASALAALSYIAAPENKALLKTMFEQSQKDADPNVQAVATEALNKLSQI